MERPFGRGITPFGRLTITMVINHVSKSWEPILQVAVSFFVGGSQSWVGENFQPQLEGALKPAGLSSCLKKMLRIPMALGFQPPLKQWVEKYNHHCLPKGFNHPNWVNHYFNGGGSLGMGFSRHLPLPGSPAKKRPRPNVHVTSPTKLAPEYGRPKRRS